MGRARSAGPRRFAGLRCGGKLGRGAGPRGEQVRWAVALCCWAAGLGKRGRGKGLGLGVELAWADGLGWEEGLRVGLLTGFGWVGYWAVSFLFLFYFSFPN